MKRFFVVLLVVCVAVMAFAAGGAQSSGSGGNKTSSGFPNRPIEIVLPADAGTGTDTTLRAIVPTLEKYLGVSIMVVNEARANGSVALTRVKNARADGYTWGYWNIVAISMNCTVGDLKGNVDPLVDYVWGGGNYYDANNIITRKDGPYKTIDDIVNAAKARPGEITFGRMGPISTDTAYIMYLEEQHGIKFNPINSLEGPAGIAAIRGGHLDVMTDNVSSSWQQYQDGAFEIVGVGGDKRSPLMPDVPTFDEQGYHFPIQASERHFYAPVNVDKEIVDFMREAIRKAAADPEYHEMLSQLKLDHYYFDGDTSRQSVQRYVDTFKAMQ